MCVCVCVCLGDPATQAMVRGAAEYFTQRGVAVRAETPEESVEAQVRLLDGLKPSDNGLFMVHTGGEYNLEQLSSQK